MSNSDPKYDVVWPLGHSSINLVEMNPRLGEKKQPRIGFLWDYIFRGDEMFPLIQGALAERFPGSQFVPHTVFGNTHGPGEREYLALLPERLRAENLDAVVVGVAA